MAWRPKELQVQSPQKEIYDMVVDQRSQSTMNHKLDNILNLLHNIDDRLRREEKTKRESYVPSSPPTMPLPPIPRINSPDLEDKPKRPPPTPYSQSKPLPPPPVQPSSKLNAPPSPPPIPPKHPDAIHPQSNKDGSITFTASQCLCLTLQLKAVRMFIDENFEDEYVDKELNMNCLDSAIRTLSGVKK